MAAAEPRFGKKLGTFEFDYMNRTSRQKVGALMTQYHGSMGDPYYAVGSYYIGNHTYPKLAVVEEALDQVESDIVKADAGASGWGKQEGKELRAIKKYLKWDIARMKSAGSASGRTCSKKIRVQRKGYVRRDGSVVRPTSFTQCDPGTPGRRTRGSKAGPFKKQPKWVQHAGTLGGAGYTQRPERTRHKILRDAVDFYGYASTARKLHVILRSTTIKPATRRVVEADVAWLRAQYRGGTKGRSGGMQIADKDRRKVLLAIYKAVNVSDKMLRGGKHTIMLVGGPAERYGVSNYTNVVLEDASNADLHKLAMAYQLFKSQHAGRASGRRRSSISAGMFVTFRNHGGAMQEGVVAGRADKKVFGAGAWNVDSYGTRWVLNKDDILTVSSKSQAAI